MRASTILSLALTGLSFAAAQSTVESGCGSQIDTIIAACLSTTELQLNACASNDWGCLCTQTTNVLTCYNNCPSDPNRNGVLQQQTSYCNAASAYPSSTTARPTSAATAAVSAQINAAATTASDAAQSMGTTASASAATSSPTHGAAVANVAYPGLAIAFLGLAAFL